jgi:2-polyprenyl-3-methyl-5-hydroxy-6-metoxy-1,4-benzoquinol methylase
MPLQDILTHWRRYRSRLSWERQWSRGDYHPHWLTESPRPYVLAGFDQGWLSPGMDVLEIGCGLGHTAAALASRGIRVVGIDVSRHAIRRARTSFPNQADLIFRVVDVCARKSLGTCFDVIIDTGCLHNIAVPLQNSYRRSILHWSRPGTRFVVSMHTVDTSKDTRRAQVHSLFVPPFELVHYEEKPSLHPDARGRLNPVFHLIRRETTGA